MKHARLHSILSERLRVLAALALLVGVGLLAFRVALHVPLPTTHPTTPLAKANVLAAYGKLPVSFEKNQGQTDPNVKFLARGNGFTLFLTDGEAVLRLRAPKSKTEAESVVRIGFAGSNAAPKVEGLEIQPGRSNYLIGNNPARWQRNVPLYGRVKYRGAYPGIDAVYYGNQSQLETDYIVAPGSDPKQITLQVSGGEDPKLNAQGDLVVGSAAGDLILRRPNVYQEIDGSRREIAANYVQQNPGSVGIHVASYDSTKPLVVDPVVVYSTYLGGSTGTAGGAAGNSAKAVAVDSNGNAYVTGSTSASNFPVTAGAYQNTNESSGFLKANAFITKLNSTGTALVYSTYLGGSVSDGADGIGVDSNGNVYVTGSTSSLDFPVTAGSAIESQPPQKNNFGASNVFFSELDPNGANLLYSTYLGGNGADSPGGLALDANANAYITGSTTSTNFPISPNALQNVNNAAGPVGTGSNVFVSRIDSTKTGLVGLVYSTYLGGSENDSGSAIAVDANADAYIVGTATSSNFPTVNAFQSNLDGTQDAFIARVDTVNSVLVYSTYLGEGADDGDTGNCIAVDANFNVYVGGHTYDQFFPVTAGAFETTFPAAANDYTGFVARFDTSKSGASSLIYATFLGGNISGDQPHAIAIDSLGNAYLTGETWSGNFPVTLGAPYNTGIAGLQNGFVSVLSASGSQMLFSTYYGSDTAVGYGLALDTAASPDVFIVGSTNSTKFPTTAGAYDTSPSFVSGFSYAFVAELSPAAAQGFTVNPSSLAFGNQPKGTASASQLVTIVNDSQNPVTGITISFIGPNASDFTQTNNCPVAPPTLPAATACTVSVTFTPSTTAAESATLNIVDSDPSSPQTVTLTGTGTAPPPGVSLTPTSLNFGSLTVGTASLPQAITLSNNSLVALSNIVVSITGANAADFAPTTNCPVAPATLAASGACTITITFTPSLAAVESATLSVTDSDASSPQTAALSGTGTAPAGSVSVAPTSINFGNVNINATSPVQKATLTNSKATTLTITSVGVTGPNASDFAAGSACGPSLAANSNCLISVTFTPTIVGAESATLNIVDSDSTSPQTVALSGTGAAALPDYTISALPTSATVGTH
ncbi:MAG TPA: choice-of-anchor D domain-containing protein, partial [Candidatus Acidoferrales bacterium]|nr:choice-of-anchor D domain-containing protein [Candidatus Acidoferrales bacterium]